MVSGKTPGKAPRSGQDGNWVCGRCGNVNLSWRRCCNRCNALRDDVTTAMSASSSSSARPDLAPLAGVDGNWRCGCGNLVELNLDTRSLALPITGARLDPTAIPLNSISIGSPVSLPETLNSKPARQSRQAQNKALRP